MTMPGRSMRAATVAAVTLCALGASGAPQAQRPQPEAAAQPAAERGRFEAVPLKVTIIFSRMKDGAPVSSAPFELFVRANTNASTSLNLGVDVPLPQGANSFTYRRVGHNIACSSASYENGLVTLQIMVEESSIYPAALPTTLPDVPRQTTPPPPPAPGMAWTPGQIPSAPAFRSFTTSTVVSMLEGQTVQFTLATEKETGETIRVSVMAARVR